ncbi:hypothetical protein F6R98_10640 [Candidatus Methylospira mobilis]|uniref:Very short patch repair endonuclease n=1 Tax=Candidatus Methylospira mobilis TaxID=1808979 RepID=A0A5Q0BMQ5_9GAMM|nr:hypothetical protein [Candidatus Methylospira mobilis]QFY43016.1 hypothetical protein F6R98_10640 [Candidatus Methylospira mobilis]
MSKPSRRPTCPARLIWRGHDCKRGARAPKENADYWANKISRNRARDAGALDALKTMGWEALVIWECQLKNRDALDAQIRAFLGI